ncbi:MAG: hypothetical protein ACYCW6_03270 [Candidatus Xenobia bacterium]
MLAACLVACLLSAPATPGVAAPLEPAPTPAPARWIAGSIPGIDAADLETALMEERDLKFRRVVPARVHDRETLRRFLVTDLKHDENPGQETAVLEAFDFVPPRFDLMKFQVDLLTQQIAGYYDPRTGCFNVIDEPGVFGHLGSLLNGLLGIDERRIVTIHEMDHALDDQYFQLKRLQDRVKAEHNDDASLALQALVEGEATWIMMADAQRGGLLELSRTRMTALRERMDLAMAASAIDVDGRPAPLFFQRSLLYPYQYGLYFVHFLRTFGLGWQPVNDAWADVPTTTQEILHPERYMGTRDAPDRIVFTSPFKAHDGWEAVDENTLGEWQLRLFLEQHTGQQHAELAAHWHGDRYRVYRHGETLGLVWVTVWDAAAAAAEFARLVPPSMHAAVQQDTVVVTRHLAPQPFQNHAGVPVPPRVVYNDASVRLSLEDRSIASDAWDRFLHAAQPLVRRDCLRLGALVVSPSRRIGLRLPAGLRFVPNRDNRVLLQATASHAFFMWYEDDPAPRLHDYANLEQELWVHDPQHLEESTHRLGGTTVDDIRVRTEGGRRELHRLIIPVGDRTDVLQAQYPLVRRPEFDALFRSVRISAR